MTRISLDRFAVGRSLYVSAKLSFVYPPPPPQLFEAVNTLEFSGKHATKFFSPEGECMEIKNRERGGGAEVRRKKKKNINLVPVTVCKFYLNPPHIFLLKLSFHPLPSHLYINLPFLSIPHPHFVTKTIPFYLYLNAIIFIEICHFHSSAAVDTSQPVEAWLRALETEMRRSVHAGIRQVCWLHTCTCVYFYISYITNSNFYSTHDIQRPRLVMTDS